MLRSLPRNQITILDRQKAVAYFSQPSQMDLIKSIQDCIGKIRNVSGSLKKFSLNQSSVRDWKTFKRSVAHLVLLSDLCAQTSRHQDIEILSDLVDAMTSEIRGIAHHLEVAFDVEVSESQGKFVVKSGIDNDLDELR